MLARDERGSAIAPSGAGPVVAEVDGISRRAASVALLAITVVIGGPSGFGDAGVGPGLLIGGAKRLVGISVGSRTMLEDLARFVDLAGIAPVVDQRFAFDQAPDAYAALEKGGHFGKIVVDGPSGS